MKTNPLGISDLQVSEIGFGLMSVGTDEKQGIHLVHEAIDRGVNFLDTADLYDFGMNEQILGKAVRGKRDQVILATKVGNHRYDNDEGWYWDASKNYIKNQVKTSLKRLQTDYIDLYQLHGGTLDDPIDETIEAFEELKQEGWIRYYGISSIRPNVIREYVKRSGIISVMMQYNILDRRPEEEILELLEQHHISVIARGPVAKGILSNSRADKQQRDYLDYHPEELQTVITKLSSWSNENRSLSQIAIRYVLDHPSVATTIPGASRLDQLIQNIQASETAPLTNEEVAMIRGMSKTNHYTVHR